jgi:hypothetical protein
MGLLDSIKRDAKRAGRTKVSLFTLKREQNFA